VHAFEAVVNGFDAPKTTGGENGGLVGHGLAPFVCGMRLIMCASWPDCNGGK
jgi:hypothetical protein